MTFLAALFVTTTVLAYPITIRTSCNVHNTDTELWEGLNENQIADILEEECNVDQGGTYRMILF